MKNIVYTRNLRGDLYAYEYLRPDYYICYHNGKPLDGLLRGYQVENFIVCEKKLTGEEYNDSLNKLKVFEELNK